MMIRLFLFLIMCTPLLSVAPAYAASKQYRALASQLVDEAEQALQGDEIDSNIAANIASNIDRADELANLALTADPSNVKAYWVKARAQQAKGNNEQSLHLLHIGLQLNPENIAALNLQGDIALAVNNLEQAETSLKNLRTICGQSCAAANKLQAALDLFKQTNPPKNKE
ncbi:MAG: hypothetical protein ACR2PV_05200 [Gammaproteobacteria bacterium]